MLPSVKSTVKILSAVESVVADHILSLLYFSIHNETNNFKIF